MTSLRSRVSSLAILSLGLAVGLAGCTRESPSTGQPSRKSSALSSTKHKASKARARSVPRAACGSVSYEGCCDGSTLYFCDSGSLQTLDCSSNPSCGWDSTGSYYDCGTSGTADPSGSNPLACSGLPDGGAVADSGPAADAGSGSCGSVAEEGCCSGSVLYYCYSGTIYSYDCSSDPSCGWDSSYGWYDCGTSGTSDPSGTYPLACSGLPDGGAGTDKGATKKDAGSGSCGSVSSTGCCDGSTLYYCDSGSVQSVDCSSNPSCGWDSSYGWYDCGTSGTADPSGTYPLACSGAGDSGSIKADKGTTKADKGITTPDQGGTAADTAVADLAIGLEPTAGSEGGTTSDTGGSKADTKKSSSGGDSGGCSCDVGSPSPAPQGLALLFLGAVLLVAGRRRG
jgi:MYXO-CTERM domain-containing protein